MTLLREDFRERPDVPLDQGTGVCFLGIDKKGGNICSFEKINGSSRRGFLRNLDFKVLGLVFLIEFVCTHISFLDYLLQD